MLWWCWMFASKTNNTRDFQLSGEQKHLQLMRYLIKPSNLCGTMVGVLVIQLKEDPFPNSQNCQELYTSGKFGLHYNKQQTPWINSYQNIHLYTCTCIMCLITFIRLQAPSNRLKHGKTPWALLLLLHEAKRSPQTSTAGTRLVMAGPLLSFATALYDCEFDCRKSYSTIER